MKKDEILYHKELDTYVIVVGPTAHGTVHVTNRNGTVIEVSEEDLEPLFWNPSTLNCLDESPHEIHDWLEPRDEHSLLWRCLGVSAT